MAKDCELYDGLPVVYRSERGVAVLWFKTNRNTGEMFRIYYADGSSPLATNTMDIVKEQLDGKPKPDTGQLRLGFDFEEDEEQDENEDY